MPDIESAISTKFEVFMRFTLEIYIFKNMKTVNGKLYKQNANWRFMYLCS